MIRALIVCLVLAAPCARGALITLHEDATLLGAALDGAISTDEYGPGNAFAYTGGGSGFGLQLGNATMYLKSDVTNLYVAFSNIATNNDGNQYIVYFQTRPGGFQTRGGEMTDGMSPNAGDNGRRNTSILSTNGAEAVWFEEAGVSNKPDFALVFNNRNTNGGGFSVVFELRGAGQAHGIVPHLRAGVSTTTVEFRIPRGGLGVPVSGAVDVAAFEVSATGFMADGGLPLNTTNVVGFGDGQTNLFLDFHRFLVTDLSEPVGLTQRVANTTLKMPSTLPAPTTNSYATANAFGTNTFSAPMAVAAPPGETNRLFVAERSGTIAVITNLANAHRSVFMNIGSRVSTSGEGGILALAFHPDYASNGYFYIWYTTSGTYNDRLSRFQVMTNNPNAGNTNSEVVLINQFDEAGNHNGGDLHFGQDGYLYLSLGDEGDSNDSRNNSQTINKDFFAGLIRIDVDKKPGSLPPNHHTAIVAPTNYAIPPDNPYLGVTNFNGTNIAAASVRTEFWAIGLRNPFRWSFDDNGDLYLGDVGQGAREEVNLIQKGSNYGWAYREGRIAGPKATTQPASNFRNPILDYPRASASNYFGNVITGGRVYRGSRLPELYGKYIFSDHGSGFMWSLAHDGSGTNATSWTYLATDGGLVYFGRDPRDGDILICDLFDGQIKRLVYASVSTNALPQDLAQAGVFADLPSLTPFPGIVPFDINVPFWSDNAHKTRWFSVPSTNLAFGFDPELPWASPTGTVWIKHFDLLLTSGVPASARRVETRLLVKNAEGAGGYGVTYRWGSSMTNAALIPAGGLDEPFVIDDGGTIRTQVWRYPSRTECLVCHQAGAGFALGFNTVQLNRERDYHGAVSNQLQAFNGVGYFSTNVTGYNGFRALAHATNTAVSLEQRVRSYLQANCRQCHFPGGTTPAPWDARVFTPLSAAGIVDGVLVNTMGDTNNVVVRPGELTNSMLHRRIALRGATQMPPLGSNLVDTQGVALVAAWITTTLTNYQSFAAWQLAYFGSTNAPDADPGADPDGDGAPNRLEYLTGTSPTNDASFWGVEGLEFAGDVPQVVFERPANLGVDAQVATNLLDPVWRSLDTPANSPHFGAVDEMIAIDDPEGTNDGSRYYRANVYEP